MRKVIILVVLILSFFSFYYYNTRNIYIYGNPFPVNSTTLNLKGTKITNINELSSKISKFKHLQSIDFGDNIINDETKKKINELYPNIKLNAIIEYELYGNTYHNDIEYLDLSNIEIDNNLTKYLENFPKLKEVDFKNKEIDLSNQIELFEKYPDINFKWKINLNGTYIDQDTNTINLKNKKLEINDLRKSLKLLTNLEYIDLSDTNLTNEELEKLRIDFPKVKIVWRIYFGEWSMKTDDIAFSVKIPKHMHHKRLTSEDIEVLKYCTDLQALDLGHQAITDISVIGNYLKDLRVLILADNKISDLSPLSNLENLHYLEVFMNKITDLSPLEKCKNMVDLNISYNLDLKNIDSILKFSKLERLWLVMTKVSNNNYKLLKETYPNSKIVKEGWGTSTGSGWRTHPRYYAMIDMFNKNYISKEFSKYDS